VKYVFDIDGTICSETKGDYSSATPITERIDKINELYSQGHKIIFYTARGMGTFENNSEKAKQQWYKFTHNQLKEWGVKFNFLFLGKPSGDFYIDDKSINDTTFFN
jgi:capsule biosynthesis phosphatase